MATLRLSPLTKFILTLMLPQCRTSCKLTVPAAMKHHETPPMSLRWRWPIRYQWRNPSLWSSCHNHQQTAQHLSSMESQQRITAQSQNCRELSVLLYMRGFILNWTHISPGPFDFLQLNIYCTFILVKWNTTFQIALKYFFTTQIIIWCSKQQDLSWSVSFWNAVLLAAITKYVKRAQLIIF